MNGPRFANLADAGHRLGLRLAVEGAERDGLLAAVVPNGVPVARAVAEVIGLELVGLAVQRDRAEVHVLDMPDVAGRHVYVVDDGVETGTVVRSVAGPLRDAGARGLVLAVPVCPAGVMATLSACYDRVIALERPAGHRALASYFADLDTIDEATARTLLPVEEPGTDERQDGRC